MENQQRGMQHGNLAYRVFEITQIDTGNGTNEDYLLTLCVIPHQVGPWWSRNEASRTALELHQSSVHLIAVRWRR